MAARIARADKDKMRAQTEEILAMHKQMIEKIEFYAAQAEVEEYMNFWQELLGNNRRLIGQLSRYMVTKCNR
ncbi:MAG TPA: hypothetical protein PKI17_02355 [Syntrophomonas sp.]|nr:hypothetical protein [Syntrophomonas sp.]